MKPTFLSLTTLFSLLTPTFANTEKTIFLGPERVRVPLTHPTLTDLRLHTLTPTNSTLRTQLPARFPSDEKPKGTETWLILDDLIPGQRYEVRVCWPATVSLYSYKFYQGKNMVFLLQNKSNEINSF